MSNFTRSPLEYLRQVRGQVFGFGRSQAADEKAIYKRGDVSVNVVAEPRALPEGSLDGINYRTQGWLISVATIAKSGFGLPQKNDTIVVGGDTWTVLNDAGGNCFARRSYGKDFLIYTKLSSAS